MNPRGYDQSPVRLNDDSLVPLLRMNRLSTLRIINVEFTKFRHVLCEQIEGLFLKLLQSSKYTLLF